MFSPHANYDSQSYASMSEEGTIPGRAQQWDEEFQGCNIGDHTYSSAEDKMGKECELKRTIGLHNTADLVGQTEVNSSLLAGNRSNTQAVHDTNINISYLEPHKQFDKTLDTDISNQYRDAPSCSTSETSVTSRTSSHLFAKVLNIVDTNQSIHKRIHKGLCKGLFGMHIRSGRGRPKKFKSSPQRNKVTKKKLHKCDTTVDAVDPTKQDTNNMGSNQMIESL